MEISQQFYAPDIAAKAVIELTVAMKEYQDVEYAKALLSDPRMSSNRGHLASCGVNMRKIKQAKELVEVGMPTLDSQRKAIEFLDRLDHEQQVMHG
ncbi:MAG: hypothetical protein DI582_02045 [Azospirillum brasilense]|nr:MAG: hypothetical protein DI582_02045 [Azospirillum brasilense]